jgi:hypothetical protein
LIRITEVVLSAARKVNLGNYESKDVFCSVKAELTNGTPSELRDAHAQLTKELESLEGVRVQEILDERDGKRRKTP